MGRIQLNHWFTEKDGLSISLLRFFARINIQYENNRIVYVLNVHDSEKNELSLHFSSLENAISFAEETVLKADYLYEIADQYQLLMNQGQIRIPGTNRLDDGKIHLTESEIYDAIIAYYGQKGKENIRATKEISLSGNHINLCFYVEEENLKIMLTEEDLSQVFQHYLNPCDLELIHFKYMGYIRRAGYYVDRDTPVFEGIQLQTKKKN